MEKKVMAFGTFDLFHRGHIYYLSEAEKLGTKLIVIIARDVRVAHGKGRSPIHTERERLESVKTAFPTASVILGHESDIFDPIRVHHPDLLAFGYDQRVPQIQIHELFPHIELVRIRGHETEKWKSSILRSVVNK